MCMSSPGSCDLQACEWCNYSITFSSRLHSTTNLSNNQLGACRRACTCCISGLVHLSTRYTLVVTGVGCVSGAELCSLILSVVFLEFSRRVGLLWSTWVRVSHVQWDQLIACGARSYHGPCNWYGKSASKRKRGRVEHVVGYIYISWAGLNVLRLLVPYIYPYLFHIFN